MQFKAFIVSACLLAFSSAQDSASVASSAASDASALVSAASSVASSLVSSASAVVAPSASSSASAAASSGSASPTYGLSCPQGLLSYYLTVQAYSGVSLSNATAYFSNWTGATTGPLLNSSGSGDVGATRTYSLSGLNVSEQLTSVNTSSTTGSLQQLWVSTANLSIAGVDIYNFTDSLNVYTNTTTNETTVQLFINACLSNQTAGLPILAQAINGEVSGWYAILQGNSTASPSASASASGSASGSGAAASGSGAPSTIASASGSGAVTSNVASTEAPISVPASTASA